MRSPVAVRLVKFIVCLLVSLPFGGALHAQEFTPLPPDVLINLKNDHVKLNKFLPKKLLKQRAKAKKTLKSFCKRFGGAIKNTAEVRLPSALVITRSCKKKTLTNQFATSNPDKKLTRYFKKTVTSLDSFLSLLLGLPSPDSTSTPTPTPTPPQSIETPAPTPTRAPRATVTPTPTPISNKAADLLAAPPGSPSHSILVNKLLTYDNPNCFKTWITSGSITATGTACEYQRELLAIDPNVLCRSDLQFPFSLLTSITLTRADSETYIPPVFNCWATPTGPGSSLCPNGPVAKVLTSCGLDFCKDVLGYSDKVCNDCRSFKSACLDKLLERFS